MEIKQDEDDDYTTVMLDFDDDLALVPETHRDLLTPEIIAVFEAPRAHFEQVRDRSPFPNMQKWVDRVLADGGAELWLEIGVTNDIMRRAGFYLMHEKSLPAVVGLPKPFPPDLYPKPLAEYYRLVSFVSWNGLMYAGQLDGPETEATRRGTLAYFNYSGTVVDGETTRLIGGSLCGDMMVCTADGQGGWWKHETGEVVLHGQIAEFMDWVFGELLQDRPPESDAVYRRK